MQQQGEFRTDLYYRLNSYRIKLPPLRQRLEDIPLLLEKFIREASEAQGCEAVIPDPQVIPLLQSYNFPGNARELRSMVFEAVSLSKSATLGAASFEKIIGKNVSTSLEHPADTVNGTVQFPAVLPTLKEVADLLVAEAMQRSGNNQTKAARLLGISRPALSKRLSKA